MAIVLAAVIKSRPAKVQRGVFKGGQYKHLVRVLTGKSLRDLTQATLIARIIFAVPAWWGFLNVAKKDRTESVIKKAKRYGYQAILKMYTLLLKVWNQHFLTAFGTIPTMFCISYYLLKRTFTIICDNNLMPFLQKTTV